MVRSIPSWAGIAVVAVLMALPLPPVGPNTASQPIGPPSHPGLATTSVRPVPFPVTPVRSTARPSLSQSAVSALDAWSQGLNTSGTNFTHPTNRDQVQLAYDPDLGQTILFGGYDPGVFADGDTWNYSNGTWTEWNLATQPAARWGAGFVYDPVDRYLVLFGGRDDFGYFNDTWVLNRTGWHQLNTTTAPSPRREASMAWDSTDGYVVLPGGWYKNLNTGASFFLNDTWTFRGGVWKNVTSTAGTSPSAPQVVDDPADGYVVGWGAYGDTAGKFWTYSAGLWTSHTSSTTPTPAELTANGVWVGSGGFVLMFGSEQNTVDENTTWAYRAGVWVNLTSDLGLSPPSRGNGGLAYDSYDARVVLFGGDTIGNYTYWGDTWLLSAVPFAAHLQLPANPVDQNATVPIDMTVLEGTGRFNYTYDYPALPPGCSSSNVSSLHCEPNSTGVWPISATIERSDGVNITVSLSLTVNLPLSASATVSRTTVDPGVSVSFAVSIANGTSPYHESWDFGDGSTGSGLIATHAFSVPGTYRANVSVRDSGLGVANASVTVTVVTALGATAFANVSSTDARLPVAFNATLGGGIGPYAIQWQFGDGGSSTGASTTHAFDSSGNFSATATITDSVGVDVVARAYVFVNPDPTVEATANLSATDVGLPVRFTGTIFGGTAPFAVQWAYGDSSAGTNLIGAHAFTQPGTYAAVVTIRDAAGLSRTGSVAVNVSAVPSVSFVTSTPGVDVNRPVQFHGTTVGGTGPETVSWTFGDGGTATGFIVTHTFVHSGNLTVSAYVTDALGIRRSSLQALSVGSILSVTAGALSASGCLGNYTVDLVANRSGGSSPATYTWGFGDGSPLANGTPVRHDYSGPGPFVGTVTVKDAAGALVSSQVTVTPATCPVPPSNSAGNGVLPTELAIGGALAVAAIAVSAVLLVRRRRSRTPPRESMEPAEAEGAISADADGSALDNSGP
ncbi:MAG TPA: PKD domain-containing protein [Thermoplasmata archaeon]|nr:PKD domain-containing protein [Thermoplasmata archaeon]